jgi:hypothetical protein
MPYISGHNKVKARELLDELIEIGSTPKIKNGEGSQPYFWRPQGEGIGPNKSWDERTRKIGEELHQLGNGSLDLMYQAHENVVNELGPLAGLALSAHWHNVGEQAWQSGNGECWMN